MRKGLDVVWPLMVSRAESTRHSPVREEGCRRLALPGVALVVTGQVDQDQDEEDDLNGEGTNAERAALGRWDPDAGGRGGLVVPEEVEQGAKVGNNDGDREEDEVCGAKFDRNVEEQVISRTLVMTKPVSRAPISAVRRKNRRTAAATSAAPQIIS